MRGSLHSTEQAILSSLLRTVREERRITQTELGKRLGRPVSFVSKVENSHQRLDLIELAAHCRALGVPLEEFVRRFVIAVRTATEAGG